MLTTSVTAANVNQIEVYPATDAALAVANTGTINMGGVMAEDNADRCSSYIATTTATVTRNKDDMKITSLGAWFNANAGTIVGSSVRGYGSIPTTIVAAIDDNSVSNRHGIGIAANKATGFTTVANVNQAVLNTFAIAVGAIANIAYTYALNDFSLAANGLLDTPDSSGTLPAVTQFDIGQEGGGINQFNGGIRTLDYYNIRVPDSALQTLAA
jgi:hypothetical protein